MVLTESDASKLLHAVTAQLESLGAREVLDGIEESRRLGVEEPLAEQKGSDIKQVGRMRRRPPNEIELLGIALRRLHERLVVVPRLAAAIRQRFKVDDVRWRVDTEFVSTNRVPEVHISSLEPDGVEAVMDAFSGLMRQASDTLHTGKV